MLRLFFFLCITYSLTADLIYQDTRNFPNNNGSFDYSTSCGFIKLENPTTAACSEIFYISFTKNDSSKKRPITFCINAQPGSSSAFLHMGAFGPKRFLTKEEGQTTSPPYNWIDNKETLLTVTDLVFIDTNGTRYRQYSDDENPYQIIAEVIFDAITTNEPQDAYMDNSNDVWQVVGQTNNLQNFIIKYLQKNRRSNSPKYLLGESYSSTKISELCAALHESGIYCDGCILLSPPSGFTSPTSCGYSFLSEMFSLPTYFLTAWYHKKANRWKTLKQVKALAHEFIEQHYAPFIFSQSYQNEQKRRDLADLLEEYSAIPKKFWLEHDFRINCEDFRKLFFQEEQQLLAKYDTTLFYNCDPDLPSFVHDPSITTIQGVFGTGFNAYLQEEYEIYHSYQNKKWDFSPVENRYNRILHGLKKAAAINPLMKIFTGSGYYDTITPFAAWLYTLGRIPSHLAKKRITAHCYEAGHIIYLKRSAHEQLTRDLIDFYQK